jgi:transcription elongation factor Elf1
MEKEHYDGYEWEIGASIGSSTPDDKFEITYAATAICPDCGEKIDGEASYLSDDDDLSSAVFDSVRYEPCECADEDDYDGNDDEEEEEEDEL